MRRFASACGFCALVLFLSVTFGRRAAGVRAGTAVRMDVADLVRDADLIVEARVLAGRAERIANRVETEYVLLVERTFEGEDQPLRKLRMPGGVLADGSGMVLAGMPRIGEGESVLLFLTEEGETGIRMPVGLAQGKFTVARTEQGEKLLTRSVAGLSLVNGETGAEVPGTGREVRTYASMVASIEAALVAKRAAQAAGSVRAGEAR